LVFFVDLIRIKRFNKLTIIVGGKMIQGKRVRLRAIDRNDLPFFVTWLNDEEVRENISVYIPVSIIQEEEWFNAILKHPAEEQPLTIEVLLGEEWRVVGDMSIFKIDQLNRSAEVGIFIGDKQYWGQGYGVDAMRLMLRHGFNHLNLNRIYLHVFETNTRGIRCYEKCGFTMEGKMRQAHYLNGKYIDVLLMSIIKSEWHDQDV
jgi:diamine N-acetyltransferase